MTATLVHLIHWVPNLSSRNKSISRKWCSFRIKPNPRMNKHVIPAFEWFMVFSHMHYKTGKKCVFYDGVTSWHQHSCRWAECTLSWGESGFSTAVPSRNKDWTRSTVKEEITYLHCQIAAPSTVLVVVISSAERGLVVSYWSVANQITGPARESVLSIQWIANVIKAFMIPWGWISADLWFSCNPASGQNFFSVYYFHTVNSQWFPYAAVLFVCYANFSMVTLSCLSTPWQSCWHGLLSLF